MPDHTKSFDSGVMEAISQSIVTPEKSPLSAPGFVEGGMTSLFMLAGSSFADALPPWGVAPTRRDSLLRWFIQSEPVAASAFTSICARNAAFSFEVKGEDEALRELCSTMVTNAEWGAGWDAFAAQLSWDLLTSDKGAYVELIGRANPEDPVIGFQTLDPMRCWNTGDPSFPVIYQDRRANKMHRLAYFQVYQIREMPQHSHENYNLQFCAASRVIRKVQTSRNIGIYAEEKSGGRYVRGIHVLSGPNPQELKDALALQSAQEDGRLNTRYMQPIVLTTLNPAAKPELVTLDLASMPDGFDEEKFMKGYYTILAMALLTDYGELAPLPGGGLGTASQTETMDKKASRKGAALWRQLVAQMMNRAVMPPGVTFEFDEQDADEDEQTANIKKIRADRIVALKTAGLVDSGTALDMMVAEGDIDEAMANAAKAIVDQQAIDEQARTDAQQQQQFEMMQAQTQARTGETSPGRPAFGQKAGLAGPSEERLAAEEALGTALAKPLAKVWRQLQNRLIELDSDAEVQEVKEAVAVQQAARAYTVRKRVVRDKEGRITAVIEEHEG